MSGRLENDSFKLLELKLNLEGNMADKIQNAYETSKNIYDDVLTQRNIFSKLYIEFFLTLLSMNAPCIMFVNAKHSLFF